MHHELCTSRPARPRHPVGTASGNRSEEGDTMKATHAGRRTSRLQTGAQAAAETTSPRLTSRRQRRLARTLAALAVSATALALATATAAQVNIESMRVGADEPGWSSTLDLNSAFQRGNRDRDTLGAGARFQYAWKQGGDGSSVADGAAPTARGGARARRRAARRQEEGKGGAEGEARAPNNVVFLTSNYSFSQLNDNRFINNATSHLRFIRQHSRRLSFEAFGQHQFNEFTRLEQRLLFGGGGRFLMIEEANFELFLGTGYMLERESLDLPPQAIEPRRSEHHRSTNYATLRFNSEDDRMRLVETVYLQARLDRIDDYRLLSETSFEIQLLRKLALAVNLNIAHDSEPPFGVKSTDVVLSNSLRYTFQ